MPRLSLTARQLETPAGAELLAICQSITADGHISNEELSRLHQWLATNPDVELPAREHLLTFVNAVLDDGRVSDLERKELYKAIETILPPDARSVAKLKRRDREEAERQERQAEIEAERNREREERARNRQLARINFMVAGTRYDDRADVIEDHVKVGDPAVLQRDPHNEYSRHAIEVLTTDGYQVGYVPEEQARNVAHLFDGGAKCAAYFVRILREGRSPIPVVDARIFGEAATVPDAMASPAPARPAAVPQAAPSGSAPQRRSINWTKVIIFAVVMWIILFGFLLG